MKRLSVFLALIILVAPFFAHAGVVRRATGTLKVNSSSRVPRIVPLLGYWNFDGPFITTTTAYDKSGYGFSGSLDNFTEPGKNMTYGKQGQALIFDGSDDAITIGDGIEAGNITLAAWVKPSVTKTGMKILSKKMSGAGASYGLGVSNSQADKFTATFFASVVASDVCVSSSSYTAGQWYFVVATYDGTTCHMYVNGVDVTTVSSDTADGDILDTTSALRIGAEGGATPSGYFMGILDEVRIYGRALSAEEVLSLYNSTSMGLNLSSSKNDRVTNGLVGLWSFDGPTMFTNVADTSGQGNHGFLVNFPATSTAARPGKIGQGLSFDGVDDRLVTLSTVMGTGAATFSAWVYPKSYGENEVGEIVTSGETRLRVNSLNSRFSFTSNNFTNNADSASNSVVLNRWTLVTVTRAVDGTANIYVNGVLSGSANQNSGTPGASSNVTEIGNNLTGAVTFHGIIDDVRIYNRVITSSEITTLYNLGR
jgi:hypothetical protein